MPVFRAMTPADRELVLAMADQFYHSEAVQHFVPMEILERSFAAAADPAQPMLRGVLVYEDGQPAGYLYLTQSYSSEVGGICVLIEELFLRDEFRGRGLGGQVMAWIKGQYPAARRFRLEVTPVNKRAMALYEKNGFQPLDYLQLVRECLSKERDL